jgi:ubiquinol-cytochrome c reductase iron-sulfur subunit
MSDSHGKDLATAEHGDAPLFPLPPHQHRLTDTDPRAARRAERQVALMFALSAVMVIGFIVAYVTIPTSSLINLGPLGVFQTSNLVLGLTFGLGTLLIGLGAIQWAKKLMSDEEITDERHPIGSPPEDQEAALAAFQTGVAESGFVERKLVRRTLIAALALFPIPLVVLLKDMGPLPGTSLTTTIWRKGSRIVVDVTGTKLRPEDLAIGTLVSASPENLDAVQELEGTQNARAKASIILVRMTPEEIRSQQGENWDVDGILAFSKICTHVGCPIALYQQRTHHLLCPCHQSTFDLADSGNVVFGPAARRMPQLPITVDEEGYLVAQSDFAEPVGPSFWERG